MISPQIRLWAHCCTPGVYTPNDSGPYEDRLNLLLLSNKDGRFAEGYVPSSHEALLMYYTCTQKLRCLSKGGLCATLVLGNRAVQEAPRRGEAEGRFLEQVVLDNPRSPHNTMVFVPIGNPWNGCLPFGFPLNQPNKIPSKTEMPACNYVFI